MHDDPDILVELTTARSEFEAETIAESLRSEGVPTEVFGISGRTIQGGPGVNNDVKVMVRRRDLDKAQQVLRVVKADSVDIDWNEVDVGPPPTAEPARPREPISQGQRTLIVLVIAAVAVLLLGFFFLH